MYRKKSPLSEKKMKLFRVFIETCMSSVIVYSLVHGLHVSNNINFTNYCVDDKYVFQRILHTSLDQCVVECVRRPGCLRLNYRRRFTLCSLLNTQSTADLELSTTDKACVVVDKLDVHYSLPAGCKDCQVERENCNIENGICTITECPKLLLENGLLFGNMNNVGNRVKFTCNDGYKPETDEIYSTCQANGNWTIMAKCVKECPEAWSYFKRSCYMRMSNKLDFSNAVAQCTNHGAHLAHIDDETENTFINDTFRPSLVNFHWIGLVDKSITIWSPRNWKWIDTDTSPQLLPWAPGEPFGSIENCVVMSSLGWHDIACSRLFLPLCEKELNN